VEPAEGEVGSGRADLGGGGGPRRTGGLLLGLAPRAVLVGVLARDVGRDLGRRDRAAPVGVEGRSQHRPRLPPAAAAAAAAARPALGAVSLFLLAAPWWGPHAQTFLGRNLFLAADSMIALGLALLFGMLSERTLSDSALTAVERIAGFVRRNFGIFCFLFLLGTVTGLYAVNRLVLHSFMSSADEHSCYFLAECLRLGKWFVKPHELSEFFNVVHVGNRDGKWFSVYPPGWPLILALGLEGGGKDWLNPVLCTLSLIFFFLAGKKVYGSTAAGLGLLLMASPFFAFTSASYFSHGTCLLSISIFLYAFLQWKEKRSGRQGIFWSSLAALAIGYGLNTRYLTMAAVALPFLIYYFFGIVTQRRRWTKSDTFFVIIFTILTSLVFLHNYVVTGKFFKAPNRYDKGWERLGFHSNYTVLDAAIYVLARFFYLADWFPSALIVLFLTSLFLVRDRDPLKRLFRFGFFYLVIAYFFYYSWGGNQYGPRYYYEGLPFLALALGDRLVFWWREGTQPVKKFLLGVLLVSMATSIYLFNKYYIKK